ncbi:MAG: hypothetical protein HOV67_32230 [Kribbellaceae bacterium]|nr:hypothetical protein [Kribbellaceae bacterium]
MFTKFDLLFADATPRIADGTHRREQTPQEGGRWPLSVVMRPGPHTAAARTLDDLTRQAAALAGPDHWQTGQLHSAHLTVRALEPRREDIPAGDPVTTRYLSALTRATARTRWPVGFRVTGLTLTPGTVMACAEPTTASADVFSNYLTTELGGDGWYESEPRDIWYLNLLHFTGDIADPAALIDWVGGHRTTSFGTVTVDAPELVRADHEPGPRPHMRLEAVRAL